MPESGYDLIRCIHVPIQGSKEQETYGKEKAMNFLWFLIIGGVAGWLAGLIMKGRSFGILVNIIVGIIGGIIGGWLFGLVGFGGGGLIGSLITAVVGAIVLLYIIGLFKKKA